MNVGMAITSVGTEIATSDNRENESIMHQRNIKAMWGRLGYEGETEGGIPRQSVFI